MGRAGSLASPQLFKPLDEFWQRRRETARKNRNDRLPEYPPTSREDLCSSDLQNVRAQVVVSGPKKRRRTSQATTTSARSTSCWACCARRRALRPRVLESLDITVERVAGPRSSGSSASGEEVTSGQIPFHRRGPRRCSSVALARSAEPRPTTTSAPSTILLGLVRENEGVGRPHPSWISTADLREDPQRGHPDAVRPRQPPRLPVAPVRPPGAAAPRRGQEVFQACSTSSGRNLTKARPLRASLTPVVGRETEIERIMQILFRAGTKNNPVLVGEPGRRQDRRR